MIKLKNWSLTKKIITFTATILLAYSLILGVATSIKTKNTVKPEINRNILNTLNAITANIDGDKLESLIKNSRDSNDYYESLQNYLEDVREKSDFEFLYTLGEFSDGNFHYVVEASKSSDKEGMNFGEQLEYSEDEETPYEAEKETLKSGSFVTDIEHYEEWGYIITGNVAIYNSKNEPVAILSADLNADEYSKSLNKTTNFIMINLVVGGIFIAICIGIYLAKSLKSMKDIQDAALSIAEGNLNVSLEVKSKDEIGKIKESMNQMRVNLNTMIGDININSKEVFTYSNSLKNQSEQFTASSEKVASSTMEITNSSEDQYERIQLILDKAEHINSEVTEIINKMDKVSLETEVSFSQAQKGEKIIKDSTSKIINANDSMEISRSKIVELETRISEVTKFVGIVTNISKQTNLLALNAAIEASRAGEAGRGFSVVADEVRKLADESSKATSEINGILDAINISSREVAVSIDETYDQIKEGVISSKDAQTYFKNILDSSNNIKNNTAGVVNTIEGYADATEDILFAVKKMNESTAKLSKNCENLSAISEEQFASSEEILKYASDLKGVSEKLEDSVSVFNT